MPTNRPVIDDFDSWMRDQERRTGSLERRARRRALAAGEVAGLVPTGVMMPFAAVTPPTGYLLCDGNAVSRTAYATLFALIGTTYGVGNGSTTFNVPNLKGRVVVGVSATDTEFDTIGETGGAKTHTLSTAEIPAHDHVNNPNSWQVNNNLATGSGGAGWLGGGIPMRTALSTGGGGAHNNIQPYIALNYIIKT